MSEIKRDRAEVGRIMAGAMSIFIDYTQTKVIREHLDLELEIAKHCDANAGVAVNSITMIEADSRCGKTRTIEEYIKNTKVEDGCLFYLPVPSTCSAKALTVEFLSELGDRLAHKVDSTSAQNTSRILEWLHRRKVKMIFVNEFQHIYNKDRTAVVQESLDWFKVLLERTRIPVVLVGHTGFVAVAGKDIQIGGRTRCVLRLKALSWPADKIEFRYFLEEYEKALAPVLKLPSNLKNERLARKIHQAAGGNIGHTTRLLQGALREALQRPIGPDCILERDLHAAVAFMGFGGENPFEPAEVKAAA